MSLHEKLFNLRKEVGAVAKNAKNPFYKSKYVDINGIIDHIQPFLDDHSLLLTQPIKDGSQYSIITDVETGDSVESSLELPTDKSPQDLGSAITYYRRYTLQSLLALQAEDDDANLASKKTKPTLENGTTACKKAIDAVKSGEYTIAQVKSKYKVPDDVMELFEEAKQSEG